jgi:tRNA-modifying protein YgfZ
MEKNSLTSAYQALRSNAAWRDVSDRTRIRVSGEDRARLLHAMTTNHVQGLKPGQGCYAFFLNAQGRILADANLLCFEDSILIDAEPELRTKIYEHLDRYIIADDVTLDDETGRNATIAVEGPQAADVLTGLGVSLPHEPYSWSACRDLTVARLDTTGAGGYFLIAPAANRSELLSHLAEIPEATAQDARVVRLEHGRPRYGEELTERYLVQETSQMHAIHFSKGCYLGQEIVERVRSRGQVHRLLRRVEIDTTEPPAEGAKLTSSGAPAGEIASAAFSPGRGKSVALAYVRAPFSDPGTPLEYNSTRAQVS